MGAAYDRLVSALQSGGYKTKAIGRDRVRSACPAHGGDDLNLAIAAGDQGVLTKCFSYDCPAEDVAKALGLTLSDLFDEGGHAVYDYGDGHRVERKRTRDGKKIYQKNKPKVTNLYRHPDSEPLESPSGYVVLVEGEKCVDAALRLGERCVTTWPGGASNVDQVDLSPLGGQRIRIIADNDEPGLHAAARLSARLAGIATVESIWTAPVEKESVDDIWVRGGSLEELTQVNLEPEPVEQPERSLSLLSLSDVETKRTRFLWADMIPLSALSLMGGRGGTGKSTFALWLAGQMNRGTIQGELFGQPAPVLYISHEDSISEVVGPRADANGVIRSMFYQLSIRSKTIGGNVVPAIPEDLPLIRQAIQQTGARMLIIDPITSTLQGKDNDKVADVRMVTDPLNNLAGELSVAIIGILHFRKGQGALDDLISGSHAWRDGARGALYFARDEENDRTVLTVGKLNSGKVGHSFSYQLVSYDQLTDEGSTTSVGKVVWNGEADTSVGDLINNESESRKQGSLAKDVLEYLRSFNGAIVKTQDIVRAMREDGHTDNTVRQNLKRLRDRGDVESPTHGYYRAVVTPSPGGSQVSQVSHSPSFDTGGTQVQGDSSSEHTDSTQVVTGVTLVTTPARASQTPRCRVCGFPLPEAVIAEGDTVHPSCDR